MSEMPSVHDTTKSPLADDETDGSQREGNEALYTSLDELVLTCNSDPTFAPDESNC